MPCSLAGRVKCLVKPFVALVFVQLDASRYSKRFVCDLFEGGPAEAAFSREHR